MSHATCRFCKRYLDDDRADSIKYGVRHYAHIACFLKLPDACERYLRLPAWPKEKVDKYRAGKHRWVVGVNAVSAESVAAASGVKPSPPGPYSMTGLGWGDPAVRRDLSRKHGGGR